MLTADKLLFLPSFLFFLVQASLWDYRFRKIPNALVLRMGFVGLLLNCVFFLKNTSSFLFFLASLSFYVVVAFLLYFVGFWGAGDVKFTVAAALFMHPNTPRNWIVPFAVFFGGTFLFSILNAIMSHKLAFKFKINDTAFIPIIFSPLLSKYPFLSLGTIWLSSKLPLKFPWLSQVSMFLTILMVLIFPKSTLLFLGFIFGYEFLTAFQFEGRLPSGPFLSTGLLIGFLLS